MRNYKEWDSYLYDDMETFIYIWKIEECKEGTVYHIFIVDKNTNEAFIHLPVTKESLDDTPLEIYHPENIILDENDNWYHIWKENYDKWEAGAWWYNISQIIRSGFFAMHDSMN